MVSEVDFTVQRKRYLIVSLSRPKCTPDFLINDELPKEM